MTTANIAKFLGGVIHITTGGGSHSETRVTYTASSGLSPWSGNIVGTLEGNMIPNMSDVQTVDIGNTVTEIYNDAFDGCSGLTDVTIPDSVTSIGNGAFLGCSNLLFDTTTIPGVKLLDYWAIEYTDAISDNLNLTGIRGIADGTFMGCQITSVTIPDNVTNIGPWTFNGCNLTSVTIPNSVTNIGKNAFGLCFSLTSMMIPDSVTSIGDYAFSGCSGLTSVTITANGGNAENVKQMIIDAIEDTSISNNITWNMPS